MSGALCRAPVLLVQGHLAPLAQAAVNIHPQGLQQGTCSTWSTPTGGIANVRQYSADAPEPMIIPAQRQQQNQPAVPAQRQELAVDLPSSNQGPWERVVDKTSGQPYWWNAKSGVTTPVGASKPDAWVAVLDKQTQAQYYWNKESGDTTAVGEPLPGPEGRVAVAQGYGQQQQARQPGAASVLANSLAVGFGVGLVFAIIRMIF